MYYTQNTIVKALVDERLRRATVHRLTTGEAEERDGPVVRLRHRAGHALVTAGEFVAHGVGHTAVHTARHLRPTD